MTHNYDSPVGRGCGRKDLLFGRGVPFQLGHVRLCKTGLQSPIGPLRAIGPK